MNNLTTMLAAAQETRSITTTDDTQVVQTNLVGGPGGAPFTFVDPSGISQLTVTPCFDGGANATFITQVSVTASDGTTRHVFGTKPLGSGEPQTLNLSADSLKACQIYYSSVFGGRVAGIGIQTINGQSFSVGDVSGPATPLTINGTSDVEYYYVAGIFGNSGANVDSLGFYVAEDHIVRRVLQNFVYNLSGNPPTPTPVTLNTMVAENKSSEPQTSLISFTEEVSSTSEWSSTAGITLGTETQLSTGIPVLVEGKITLSVQASYEYSWGGNLTTSKQFNYQANVDVAPGRSVSASVVVLQAPLSIGFTATYLVERAQSGISTSQISGTYNGVSAYDVKVLYADVA